MTPPWGGVNTPLGEARHGVPPRDTTQTGLLILSKPGGAPQNAQGFSGLLEARGQRANMEPTGEQTHPAEPP